MIDDRLTSCHRLYVEEPTVGSFRVDMKLLNAISAHGGFGRFRNPYLFTSTFASSESTTPFHLGSNEL